MISQSKNNAILNALTGKATLNAPTSVYLGLCVTEPNAATGALIDEPSFNTSYERKMLHGPNFANLFESAVGGTIKNAKEIQMTTMREDQGTMYYWFLSESSTGNAYLWGDLYRLTEDGSKVAGVTIAAETVPVFYEGQLQASIDVALS